MEYRRFGKTEAHISTITLGGMRFKQGWNQPREEIPTETQEHCTAVVKQALDAGINHIETAYGYVKSEKAFGIALNQELQVPRENYYLMTKGNTEGNANIRRLVEQQLKSLQTDYFDFYAYHGINTPEILEEAAAPGGPLQELLRMKEEGIIKHLGFSTHAPLETIIRTIEMDIFSFVNLHYYYFNQRNEAAIHLAQKQDMGVFIISPNDKGGQLFNPSSALKKAIPNSTPIQWNARFCLHNPAIHTLSFGMTESLHFSEMKGIFPTASTRREEDLQAQFSLDQRLLKHPYASYTGFDLQDDPSGINIPEMLRLYKLWKCYGLLDFCKYRYKELYKPNHWYPGVLCTPENIAKIEDSRIPDDIPLKAMLTELHEALQQPAFTLAT